MFINSKKSFEIREGNEVCVIPRSYIGEVPDWVASHWLLLAAIKDGSVATPVGLADRSLEEADRKPETPKEKGKAAKEA